MRESRRFPNSPRAVTEARRFAVGLLGGVDREVTEDFAVMVSELASNSVRHGDTQFTIEVEREGDRVRVAVSDTAPGDPILRTPTAREASGRGLQIVRALADEWGVTPRADGPGKTVWFTLSIGARRRFA